MSMEEEGLSCCCLESADLLFEADIWAGVCVCVGQLVLCAWACSCLFVFTNDIVSRCCLKGVGK